MNASRRITVNVVLRCTAEEIRVILASFAALDELRKTATSKDIQGYLEDLIDVTESSWIPTAINGWDAILAPLSLAIHDDSIVVFGYLDNIFTTDPHTESCIIFALKLTQEEQIIDAIVDDVLLKADDTSAIVAAYVQELFS